MTAASAVNPARVNQSAVTAYIGLGANLGDPVAQLDAAVQAMGQHQQIQLLKLSKVYRSQPHGPQDQPDYYNAVLQIKTTLPPGDLLVLLQAIEKENGRQRDQQTRRWGARTLDLDIILYDNLTMNSKSLVIPHPRAYCREFVIQPLMDLDKTLEIPTFGKVEQLAASLPINTMQVIRHVTTDYN